jgi:hypothetical protein
MSGVFRKPRFQSALARSSYFPAQNSPRVNMRPVAALKTKATLPKKGDEDGGWLARFSERTELLEKPEMAATCPATLGQAAVNRWRPPRLRSTVDVVNGEPAKTCLLVFGPHVIAGLAHCLDHRVERHDMRAIAA